MNRDYLVIVPTYNEITSIGHLLPQLLELNLDILVVDDGSPDADGSHQVSDLLTLMNAMNNSEADLIIGSRWISGGAVQNWARRREWLSRSANVYARLLLGSKVKDMTAGFRIYRTAKLIKIDLASVKSEGYCFQIEMTKRMAQIDGNIMEVPITFIERKYGRSKMSKKIVFEAIYRVTAWGLSAKFRRKRA